MTEKSQRDVVFTPFMLRVRDAVEGEQAPAVLHFEPSRSTGIAVAIDEWFYLRAKAEHVLGEANAMLSDDAERIQLDDEYGTGNLSFTMSWRDRSIRIGVGIDDLHHGHVRTEQSSWTGASRIAAGGDIKPTDEAFLEDLAVALVSIHEPEVDLGDTEEGEQ